jgi:hypothetical protein
VAFVEGDAKDFVAGPEGYDAVACIGAPFAIDSFEDAVGGCGVRSSHRASWR